MERDKEQRLPTFEEFIKICYPDIKLSIYQKNILRHYNLEQLLEALNQWNKNPSNSTYQSVKKLVDELNKEKK